MYDNDTFRSGENFHLNACVGNNGSPDLHIYQYGYYKAAITLIRSVNKSRVDIDSLVYPIVFSARHAIELFLKNQLYNLKDINAKAQSKKFEARMQSTHSIRTLWQEYKELAAVDVRFWPYINQLEEYMIDFYEIDDTGETFRYPFDHEEIRHLTDLGCINIEVFEDRFVELYKYFEELGYLTEFLSHEYREGTIISGISREQIRKIALALPPRKKWRIKKDFLKKKEEILQKYHISSNKFSKILTLIQNHKEFASYIGVELPLTEVDYNDLAKFITIYRNYRRKIKTDDFVDVINDYTDTVCRELTKDNICAISTLSDIGYLNLYSEAYERVLEEKRSKDIYHVVFDDLSVQRGIVLEKIQYALKMLGQKTLLRAFR